MVERSIPLISETELEQIKQQVKVLVFDDSQKEIIKQQNQILKNNIYVKQVLKQYIIPAFRNDFYQLLLTESTIKYELQSNKCTQLDIKGDYCVLKRGTYIFKGMDWFYTPEQEKHYFSSLLPDQKVGWYGSATVSMQFASALNGGCQVYCAKQDLKLCIIKDQNLQLIFKWLESNPEVQKLFSSQYCVGMKSVDCVKSYLKLKKYPQPVHLYVNVDKVADCNFNDKRLFWYGTRLDRRVAEALKPLLQKKGYSGYVVPTMYSAYYNNPIDEHIVLFDPQDVLERKITHSLDWMSWPQNYLQKIPLLGNKHFQINTQIAYGMGRNNGFKYQHFYIDNTYHQKYNTALAGKVRTLNRANHIVLVTFNVHQFTSVNIKDSQTSNIQSLQNMIRDFNPDVICLQQVPQDCVNSLQKMEGYRVSNYDPQSQLCVITSIARSVKFSKFVKFTKLQTDKTYGFILFSYGGLVIANTNLDKGRTFIQKQAINATKKLKPIYETIQYNYAIRSDQFQQIQASRPDLVCGTLNAEPWSQEFKYMSRDYYAPDLKSIKTTAVQGNRRDYILYNRQVETVKFLITQPVKLNSSDHLPILHAIKIDYIKNQKTCKLSKTQQLCTSPAIKDAANQQ